MSKKCIPWLTILIGAILILPLIGIDQLGNVVEGPASWIISILVILIGVRLLMKE